jgi:hypothetical protein
MFDGDECGTSGDGFAISFGGVEGVLLAAFTGTGALAGGTGGINSGFGTGTISDYIGREVSAILAYLHVPSGVYNVGAMPVRRRELMQAYADAAGVATAHFHGPLSRRLLGARLEPLSRSVRVCSDHFSAQSGWRATRDRLDASWLEALDRTPADVTT